MTVLSFGELLLRLGAPGYTKLFQKDSLDASFCGGEANVAVSLANYGVKSEFLTVLPLNDIGRAGLNSLRYFGVDVSKVIFRDGRMGLYYLEKGASQRSSKVIYDRSYSSISLSQPDEYDWDKIFVGVDWFHWTGINPALSDALAEICRSACQKAKERNIIVSCDLNYRSKLWSPEKAQLVMPDLLQYVDVCIANEEDAEKVLGLRSIGSNTDNASINKDGYVAVARKIYDMFGCKYIATSLRKSYSASVNGWSAMLYDSLAKEAYFSREYEIQIVDRVGGGDSFAAGLIYGIISGMDSRRVVEFASAASCLKQTIEGDYNRVSLDDVERLLDNGGNGRVQR